MAGKVTLLLAFAGLAVAALVSAQGSQPNELHKVDPSNQNQQRPQVNPRGDESPQRPPTNNDNSNSNNNNNNNQLMPSPGNDDDDQQDNVFPFDPLGIFEPRPRPDRRHHGLFSFLQDPMRHFSRQRDMMEQQFRQLERQASEGQSVSYFTRNGVGYKKVCTIERIGQDQPEVPQQQLPEQSQ